jgi:hypothetical protein
MVQRLRRTAKPFKVDVSLNQVAGFGFEFGRLERLEQLERLELIQFGKR